MKTIHKKIVKPPSGWGKLFLNLLVVLGSENAAQPVVNAGTLCQ